MTDNADLYRSLYLIRRFEETVLEQFASGVFHGTTHTYLGQEANAVGVLSVCESEDIVVSNHRCHGHFLAYGGNPRALFAELMGRATGVCGGRGGSQHLHWRNFYSNGVLGGTAPIATGLALAEKFKGAPHMVILFLGDGALGEGVVYEALNIASLWRAPILFVVENNHIAQTTPIEKNLAGAIPDRFAAFGIPVVGLDSSDVLEIQSAARQTIERIRQSGGPAALALHTARFGPHSKGDDTRPAEEIERLKATRDPCRIQAARLTEAEVERIHSEITTHVEVAFQEALADPLAEFEAGHG